MIKGTKVVLTDEAKQNDCYISFKDEVLTIAKISRSTKDHPGYDEGVGGELYDFEEDHIHVSLYDWEVEEV